MIALPSPGPLFNPLIDRPALSPLEVLAGPFGLVAFLPLVPGVIWLARRQRRTALVLGGLCWLLPTVGGLTSAVLLGGLATGVAWIAGLAALRRRGTLGPRVMIALVWLGLHAVLLPLWWQTRHDWYPSRMAVLHNVGFSYFLLRLVGWGVELARQPATPLRLLDTVCWLLYPPAMRLGPVLRHHEFMQRLDEWDPRRPAWRAGLKRFGWFALGVLGLGLAIGGVERLVGPEPADFFARPQDCTTAQLLGLFYLVPVQIYLLLWTYNELAVALSLWVGLRVDDNFHRLPLATSVRDFWHRWHITVGRWLRDYVYIPLGGNRRHAMLNLTAVFVYIGLWHGASWSFLAWGLSQAAALSVQRAWDGLRHRRGWAGPRGPACTVACWLLTLHYQAATILVFADFDHCGLRFFRELVTRLATAAA